MHGATGACDLDARGGPATSREARSAPDYQRDETAAEARLRRALCARFERTFVADGRHRHALTPGANLAMLSDGIRSQLAAVPRIAALAQRLGYTSVDSPWPGGAREHA